MDKLENVDSLIAGFNARDVHLIAPNRLAERALAHFLIFTRTAKLLHEFAIPRIDDRLSTP
ncbi:hypothetical protein TMPK1_27850 [Rhodospirillales bacterium TMPK1]|uniref:Uncharacterized protein n=1 Tax=Roseiterribacter gracilis TaxID=2812848 RepID=A0A8S8X978_9PROT|nr:hypothetical protein TMPK1_27850 [Rhodospirillales bacterium TMPK1]